MKKIKHYRINLVITYWNNENVHKRALVLSLISRIAYIHNFNFAIDVNFDFSDDTEIDDIEVDDDWTVEADIFYFSSTDQTKITRKELRNIINNLFQQTLSIDFSVFFQHLKSLEAYSFPREFVSPFSSFPLLRRFGDSSFSTITLDDYLNELLS